MTFRTLPPEGAIDLQFQSSGRRRSRIQQQLTQRWRQENQSTATSISMDKLTSLSEMEHVLDVLPNLSVSVDFELLNYPLLQQPRVQAAPGTRKQAVISATSKEDHSLRERVVVGNHLTPDKPDEILIHELLAYDLGIRDDASLQKLIGKRLRLRFLRSSLNGPRLRKLLRQLPPERFDDLLQALSAMVAGESVRELDPAALAMLQNVLKTSDTMGALGSGGNTARLVEREYRIAGIFRYREQGDPWTILSRYLGTGQLIVNHQELMATLTTLGENEVQNATVFIDDVRNLKEVQAEVEALSLESYATATRIQDIYEEIEESQFTLILVVLVILVVAAIGISNTMIMSVIERSEEIGIMKAVGASNAQVQLMILFEGIVTGAFGGLLSVGLTYCVTLIASGFIKSFVEQRAYVMLDDNVIQIQGWMILVTLATAIVVATLAGLIPARKAAKLDPVQAMNR